MGKKAARKSAQCSRKDFYPILCQMWLNMMNRKSLQRIGNQGHGGTFRGFFCTFPTIVTLTLQFREACDSFSWWLYSSLFYIQRLEMVEGGSIWQIGSRLELWLSHAATLKGNGHDSILVPFILLSASALYIANRGIPFILSTSYSKMLYIGMLPWWLRQ